MSMDIIEFLEARIDEDEAYAEQAKGDHYGWRDNWYLETMNNHSYDRSVTFAHAFRFSPHRVLAECAAKRAIIEAHRRQDQYDDPMAWIVDCEILLLNLAAVYRSHPDYDKEWDDELSVL
jgi:hypothetical protein